MTDSLCSAYLQVLDFVHSQTIFRCIRAFAHLPIFVQPDSLIITHKLSNELLPVAKEKSAINK